MKIAVTGGSGFIGRHFLEYASGCGHEVVALGTRGLHEVSFNDKFYRYINCDYTSDSIESALDGVDAVVHMAGKRFDPGFSTGDFLTNIETSLNLLNACWRNEIRNVVLISTRAVYSTQRDLPWKEELASIPLNLYGAGKLAIDSIGELYNAVHGMKISSLRLAQVLGHGERGGYMLNTFIERATRKQPLNIFGRGVGEREYIYVKDVADATMTALSSDVTGIFNVGSGTAVSIKELAEIINEVFDNSGNIKYDESKFEDTAISLMDCTKTRNVLKWQPKYTLRQALEDMKITMKPIEMEHHD
jgi:UDP-glucose 4-epimerase